MARKHIIRITENDIKMMVENSVRRILKESQNGTVDEGLMDWARKHSKGLKNAALGAAAAGALSVLPGGGDEVYDTNIDLLRADVENVAQEYGKPVSELPGSCFDGVYDKWGDFIDKYDIDISKL